MVGEISGLVNSKLLMLGSQHGQGAQASSRCHSRMLRAKEPGIAGSSSRLRLHR